MADGARMHELVVKANNKQYLVVNIKMLDITSKIERRQRVHFLAVRTSTASFPCAPGVVLIAGKHCARRSNDVFRRTRGWFHGAARKSLSPRCSGQLPFELRDWSNPLASSKFPYLMTESWCLCSPYTKEQYSCFGVHFGTDEKQCYITIIIRMITIQADVEISKDYCQGCDWAVEVSYKWLIRGLSTNQIQRNCNTYD